jgi:ubiquinone/menaquinone biosynthesis C-methylase UbiE
MNAERKSGLHFNIALCLPAMTALAAAILLWLGLSPLTAVLAAIAIACPLAMAYAWRLGRRALRPLGEPAPRTRGMLLDWAAPVYDAYCPWLGIGPRFRAETLAHARLRPGERVLDVGCGTGVLTRLAAEIAGPAGQVVGIDPGPVMLAVARREAARAASRAVFRPAAIERLPFADASFDLVLSSFMLHHLPPDVKRTGLAEVFRVLKPGGRLLAVDIDRPASPFWWLLCWPLLFLPYTAPNLRGEVPAYLRAAGFAPVEACARKYGLLTFWRAARPADAAEART